MARNITFNLHVNFQKAILNTSFALVNLKSEGEFVSRDHKTGYLTDNIDLRQKNSGLFYSDRTN